MLATELWTSGRAESTLKQSHLSSRPESKLLSAFFGFMVKAPTLRDGPSPVLAPPGTGLLEGQGQAKSDDIEDPTGYAVPKRSPHIAGSPPWTQGIFHV